jgi:predicted CXXCH cytochrome family protein
MEHFVLAHRRLPERSPEMRITKKRLPLFSLLALAAGAGALLLLTLPTVSHSGIRNTKHNLMLRDDPGADDEAICVFCHTPENVATAGVAPAWNRSNGDSSFSTYDDIGRLGFSGSRAVGSSSMACLSCHDSTQALGVMWFRYDHPVGVPYRGEFPGYQPFIGSGVSRVPNDLGAARSTMGNFRAAMKGTVENRSVFWVPSSPGSGASRRRSDLPLYPRESADGVVLFIECTSCHDPHTENRTFLRVNAAGALCLTCHDN